MTFFILHSSFFILFTLLSWRRLPLAVLLTIVALPSYLIRFDLGPIPMTLLEGMLLVVFAVWVIQKIKNLELRIKNVEGSKKFFILHSSFFIPIMLFLITGTISMIAAPDLRAAAGIWKAYFIEPILFFIVLVDLMKKDSFMTPSTVVSALGLSTLLPALFALYQYFTGNFIPNPFWAAEATRRATSFYGYPNAIGLYFAPIIVLLIGYATLLLRDHPKPLLAKEGKFPPLFKGRLEGVLLTTYYLLLITFCTAAIIFSKSKGALLAIGAGLLFYALFWKGMRKWFISALVILALAFLATPQFRNMSALRTIQGGGSWEIRKSQWAETWNMLKQRPILGAGLAGYKERVAPFHKKSYIEIFEYPHNLILNFWSETGLLGLLGFAWLIIVFFRTVFFPSLSPPAGGKGGGGSYEPVILCTAAAMIALLAQGLVDVPYFKNDLAILFWVIYALGATSFANTYATPNKNA